MLVLATFFFIYVRTKERKLTMVKVRVQRVLADGNCLFRSLATATILKFTGFNCGSGSEIGKEKNIGDAFHNVIMKWIRTLVAHRLAGSDVDMHTKWGKFSLFKVFKLARKFLTRYGTDREFASRRGARRKFIERISPKPPRLHPGDGSHLMPCGVTARDISSSGRSARESFKSYVKRIARLYSWGGEAECYVASLILMPVEVFQKNMQPCKYSSDGGDIARTPVKVLFDEDVRHYDAILASGEVPLLCR